MNIKSYQVFSEVIEKATDRSDDLLLLVTKEFAELRPGCVVPYQVRSLTVTVQ